MNKLYCCKSLIEERDISFFPKISVTILLFFIGLVAVSLLRDELDVGTLIIGYYFTIFGLLSLLEPLTKIVCGNKTLKSKASIEGHNSCMCLNPQIIFVINT